MRRLLFGLGGAILLLPYGAMAAVAADWATTNGNLSGQCVQFDWMGGTATYSGSGDGTFSVTVDNRTDNKIGGGSQPDEWSITTSEGVLSGNAIEQASYSVNVYGDWTVEVYGKDIGFWAGWYGPKFCDPTFTPAQVVAPEPVVVPDPPYVPAPQPTGDYRLDEGWGAHVTAPEGMMIDTVTAWYGDPNDGNRGADWSQFYTEQLHGLTEADLNSGNYNGDPLPGVYKVLVATVHFVQNPAYVAPVVTPPPAPEPTPEPVVTPPPAPEPVVTPPPAPEPVVTPPPAPEPVVTPPPAPEPAPAPAPEPVVMPEPVVVPPPPPVVEPEPAVVPEPEPVIEPEPVPEPEPVVEPEPIPEPEPVVEPEPAPEPEPVVEPIPEPEPVPVVVPEPPAPPTAPEVVPMPVIVIQPTPEPVAVPEPAPEPSRTEVLAQLAEEAKKDDIVVPEALAEVPVVGAAVVAVVDALNALGNVGADMTPEVRETAKKEVIAAVIVGQVAQTATMAAATASSSTAGRRRNE